MKDRDIIARLEAISASQTKAALRREVTAFIEVIQTDCPNCGGQGWTGWSEISGEQCDTCEGTGKLPADEAKEQQ